MAILPAKAERRTTAMMVAKSNIASTQPPKRQEKKAMSWVRKISRCDRYFKYFIIYTIYLQYFPVYRLAFVKANAPLSESLMTLRSVCCCRRSWMKKSCNTIVSWSRSDWMLHGNQTPRQTLQRQKMQQQLRNLLQPISCSSSVVSYNLVSFGYSP